MKTLIVTARDKINAAIASCKVQYVKTSAMLHSIALSVIYHAVHFGDVRPMNAFFGFLNPNDQNAFRAYLNRLSYEITRDGDTRLFKYSATDGFTILRNDKHPSASEYKATATLFVTDRLASENPGKWQKDAKGEETPILPFYASQTFKSDLSDYTDANVMAVLRTVIRNAGKDVAPGGGKVLVSTDVLNAVERAIKVADRMVNNDSAVAERKADKADKTKAPPRKRESRKAKTPPAIVAVA